MMPRRFLATLFPAKVPGGRALIDDTQVILYIAQDQFVPFSLFRLKHNLVAVELIHYCSSNYNSTTRGRFTIFT